MNARYALVAVMVASVCGLGGCKALLKKKGEEAAASASAVAAAAPVAPPTAVAPPAAPEPAAVAEPDVDEATVPAPQDFEDEAAAKVTPANFKTELARLKKEVGP